MLVSSFFQMVLCSDHSAREISNRGAGLSLNAKAGNVPAARVPRVPTDA